MDDNAFSMDNINAMLSQIMQNPDSINSLLNSFSANTSQNNTSSAEQNTNTGQNQGFDLSSLLNNINPDMLNSVLSSLGQQPPQNQQNQAPPQSSSGNFDPSMLFGMLGGIKGQGSNFSGGMDGLNQQGDNASRFLMSLKPFVNSQRQSGIDNLCQLLKYVQIAKLFGFDITKLIKL